MHVASLVWHFAVATLLLLLLMRLGLSRIGSWGLAVVFAVHPLTLTDVQWIACQSELMVTAWLLLATLAWLQARGLPEHHAPVPGRARLAWLAVCLLAYVFALGSRENAVMFPAIVLAGEVWAWRQRRGFAWGLLATLAVISIAYLALRTAMLGGAELPPRPYVVPPTSADFPRFVLDKLLYYLLGLFITVPIVPIGGVAYLRDIPLVFYGASLALVAFIAVVVYRERRTLRGWIGPVWLVMTMLPVLPAFESPHHLYLPAVGWAIVTAGVLAWIAGDARRATSRLREVGAAVFVGGMTLSFVVQVHLFSYITLNTAQGVEDQVVEALAAADLQEGDTIYCVNFPLIAHYSKLAVQQRTGIQDLRVVPLNWAPRLLGVVTPSELRRIDDRTLEVRVANDEFFAGPLARLVKESLGEAPQEMLAKRVQHAGFTVEWLPTEEPGIRALRFTFTKPWDRPDAHVFWGSRMHWAHELNDKE